MPLGGAGNVQGMNDAQLPDAAASEELVMPSVPTSVARARRYAMAVCSGLRFPGDCDVLVLLVSEMVTNALVHGHGQVTVRVTSLHQRRLRLEVADSAIDRPVVRPMSLGAEGGRGMALIDALADSWGVDGLADGKVVWAELAA